MAPPLSEPLALEVKDLHFSYPGGDPVLKGVNLTLRSGEVTGLLGANGSGKSTLLGAMTNSIEGDRRGHHGNLFGEFSEDVGFATQDVASYLHLTVAENLEHAARIATGTWKVRDLVDAAVDEFQLGAIAGKAFRQLSGGQKRVAHLAASFVHRPRVRLLDEPTTALDFATRQLLVELVDNWRHEGVATLVTAHYPEDVEELCTTITMLVEGETYDLGSLRDYLDRLDRLGSIEYSDAGATRHVELSGSLETLADITRAANREGVDAHKVLREVVIRAPQLRDLLRKDPTLRVAVDQELNQ